jgi:two-component sensor histidine kinase
MRDAVGHSLEASVPASVEILFRPSTNLVPVVRRFVNEFYARVLADAELTSRLALATHELVENAVKYGCSEETRLRLQVAHDGNDQAVVIQTWNRIDSASADHLRRHFTEMKGVPADEHYQHRMKIAAKSVDGSGLGLARIRAESDMTLDFALEGDTVCISARASMGNGWLREERSNG